VLNRRVAYGAPIALPWTLRRPKIGDGEKLKKHPENQVGALS
jgi:hypothetical protein